MDKYESAAPAAAVPRHVAIIMDGNNRWAKKRLLPGVAGHKAGVDAVRAVIEVCVEVGVEVLTLFAFSSENWQRPAAEVGALMELFLTALRREAKKLRENGVCLRIIGDRSRFSPELQGAMHEAELQTAGQTGLLLQVAANYGGGGRSETRCRTRRKVRAVRPVVVCDRDVVVLQVKEKSHPFRRGPYRGTVLILRDHRAVHAPACGSVARPLPGGRCHRGDNEDQPARLDQAVQNHQENRQGECKLHHGLCA